MPAGRPTKYKPEYIDDAAKLAMMGATVPMMADWFDVNRDTITEWMKVHVEFSAAIKKGRIKCSMAVAGALYDQCMAGNVTAQIFWLKTRCGWSEKSQIEISEKPKPSDLDFNAMTDEQLQMIVSLPRIGKS